MPNIELNVGIGETKQLTFNCANTYTPEDIVFSINATSNSNFVVGPSQSNQNNDDNITVFNNQTGNLVADSGISVKRLWENVEVVTNFISGNYYINNSTGLWYGTTSTRHRIYPLQDIREVEITAGNRETRYAFLKTYTAPTSSDVGTAPDYSGNSTTTGSITAGTTRELTVPSDANYLYILQSTASYTYTPASIKFTGIGITEHDGTGSGFIKDDGSVDTTTYLSELPQSIPSGWLGSGSSQAATGNHTHTISITNNGNNVTGSLSANTQYTLTAGGDSVNFTTPTDTNYYPTDWTWTNGTTAGPTAVLQMVGGNNVSIDEIPSASATISGVVTTGTQELSGVKKFKSDVWLYNSGSGATPALVLQRGDSSNYYDWRIQGVDGYLNFDVSANTSTFSNVLKLYTNQITVGSGVTNGISAPKFVKNSSSTNILLANGNDIAQSTFLTPVTALSATPTATLSSSTLTFKQFSQATSAQVSQADSSTVLYFNSAPTDSNKIATMTDINSAFQVNDAMVFKGTIGTGGTVTALPDTHYQGWTYKVTTAGTYAGKVCEVGDMIICVTDGTSADNSHWTVVQSNIDGAVTGPVSAVNNHIAVFNGTTGKIIKDSGFTIEKSVPGDAVFTDTDYVIFLKSEGSDPEKVGQSKSLNSLVVGHYFVFVNEENTARRELSLTFGGVNNATIYIDDKISSADNWELPAGLYFAYFDGRFWYFERRGKIISDGFRTHGGSSSQFLKANGTVDSTSYLPRSGGQMTGPLTWANSTALPEQTNPQYVLTVDAFTNGGTTKFTSIANLASAHTHTTSIQTSSDTNQITLDYGTKYSITAGGTSYVFTMPSLGTSATTAAAGNHTHTTTIATSSATNQLTLGYATKYSIAVGDSKFIFTTPSLGTTSSTAAAGNHTHTTTVATSTGTSQLALGYGAKYSITAGGTSYIFTTPSLGTTSTTAAAGNHTHTTSIATSTATNQLTLGYGSKYSLSAGGTSYVFTMPNLGTTSTTAATGDHTHTTSIATSTGTSQITLTHGGKFSITAGGTSYIFTMPSDSNTDTLVKQTVDATTTEYPILLSAQSSPESGTAYESKYSNSLKATGSGDMVFQKSSDKCTLQFDNTLKCLNFIFE